MIKINIKRRPYLKRAIENSQKFCLYITAKALEEEAKKLMEHNRAVKKLLEEETPPYQRGMMEGRALAATAEDQYKAAISRDCKYCKQDEKGYHENDCPMTRIHEGYGAMQELSARHDKAVAVLKQLEWSNHDDFGSDPMCPVCGNMESQGHEQNCCLAMLIR